MHLHLLHKANRAAHDWAELTFHHYSPALHALSWLLASLS
jgi:hypothetical protein